MNGTSILLIGGLLYFFLKSKAENILNKVNVQILKLNFSINEGLNTNLLIQVANPLSVDVQINDYVLSLKLSGQEVAKGIEFVNFKLNARSKTNIPLTFKVNAIYTAELIKLLAQKNAKRTFQIVGTVSTSAGNIPINENFNFVPGE